MPNPLNPHDIELVGSYHKPFWFPFRSVYVPVTPCVLDGSLSFLEMVWKILRDLNKTIEATNENHTDIMTLVEQMESLYDLYANKLSFMLVNFTNDASSGVGRTITADKSYNEIVTAYADKIVIGRGVFANDVEEFSIAMASTGSAVVFYSLSPDDKLNVVTVNDDDTIDRHAYTVITSNGGTVTGVLNVPAPTANDHAANKKYVDDALTAAESYADQHDATTLQSAKDYADAQDVINLAAAKTYADQYKTLRGVITYEDGAYKCNQTFATLYGRATSGLDVELVFSDPLVEFKFDVLHLDQYQPTTITFKNSTYTCTISSSDVVTFS